RLENISIGDSVVTIGSFAFYNCANSSFLSLPYTLVSIGSNAFTNCDNLLSLDTRNVVSVGDSAFANCDRLVQVNIGDSVRSIGNGAFEGCFRMSSANIGKSVQTIGNNAFSGCIRLVSPALPETLTNIGASAFNGCSRFEGMLTLPRNLAQIGDSAYWGCSGITAITAKPTNPPIISENTFNGISNDVPVYVPCGRVLNYYVTDYWENFPNIQEATPFEVSLSSNDNAMGVAVVAQQPTCSNHQCHIRSNANYGYHFLKWNDGNESNPRILELDSDTAFTAIFVVNNSYISVQCNDSTMGSVSGSGLYSYNAPVEMRATPYTNYHFQRWHDGVTDNPRYLLATQDSTFTAVFMPNVSTVTLSNNNPEMGTVSGGGVYYYQNQISISATANYGYHFTSWHDGNTANPRMITVTQDTAFTANFAVNIYAVSATSNNNTMGSVSGGGNYNYQSLVALTATPAYGYHFEQWNDGLSNNPRTINVIQDTMFMAQFAANTYSITVQANDPRMGSAYGTGNFSYNTTTTLSATATYGYHFVQWSDGNTENPRTVPVTQNAIYTAIFEINTYAVSVGSSNPAIGSAAGGGTYSYNTIVNISATPNYGYHFVQWSDGNTENPRTITVIQNATYTAQFSINSYAVSVSPNNSSRGTVSGSGSYTYNTVATISASAFYGYHFVQWSDGNTENPRSLVVMQDENYTAQFDANNYLLTANSTDVTLGNVTGGGTYEYNSLVAITANAIEHYHFVQWNDSITDNPRTIVLTRDTTFTASFAIDKHSVATTSNNPTMGEAIGSGDFDYNSATYISAEAFTGYHFVQWSDGATANPRRIIVTQDTIFTAEFEVNGYTATIQSNDETMGTVTGSGFYDYRTTLELSATAFYGYHFARWNDGNTDNPRTLVITQDTALTAIFEISSFTITVEVENAQMGSVSGSGNYNYLSQATIIATAATNYHFEQWSDGSTTNPRLINVTSDSVFVAQFAENPTFTITALSADTARGMVYGGGVYHTGERASLVASPHEHYYFSHWADGSTQNPRTITVLSDATYTAYFAPYTYIITANSNNPAMGGVSGGGAYAYGETATLTARAYEGYHFVRWDDGNANATREVLVQSDESYMAIFAQGNDENGIDEVHYADLKIYSVDGQIVVECSETLPVYVYDIVGRHIYSGTLLADEPLRINVPNTGVYVVKVGELKAEKVAVW
ncbi:MAG: leucine-rich repeat protein, partial [Bacteroidales bacterium]|nr:leucine-rich repeat protein [Bacteroidales bacterium]